MSPPPDVVAVAAVWVVAAFVGGLLNVGLNTAAVLRCCASSRHHSSFSTHNILLTFEIYDRKKVLLKDHGSRLQSKYHQAGLVHSNLQIPMG